MPLLRQCAAVQREGRGHAVRLLREYISHGDHRRVCPDRRGAGYAAGQLRLPDGDRSRRRGYVPPESLPLSRLRRADGAFGYQRGGYVASPEMVSGKKYDGFKIDVWSCGIILYAMLCGYLPFEDPDNEVLFKKILECKLEFPEYVNKLSIDLIEKILVTDPEKRITIKEIKKHPFYLKGKEIFEEGFSLNNLVQNPIEKNMGNKNDKENIDINMNINDANNNQEITNEEEVIEIDLNERKKEKSKEKSKEKIVENKEKENMADIGYKNLDNNNNNDKIKEEKRNEINKDNLNTIDVNNNNNELMKNKKEKKTKKKNKKINTKNKNNDIQNNKNNEDAVIINDKEIENNEKKQNKLNIEINLDNKLNKNDEEKRNYKKNIIPTEQEEVYMPLKTEYNNLNLKFNTLDDIKVNKQNKENQKDRIKKNKDIIRENNLKKYFELKPKEKSNLKEKSKPKSKEKLVLKSKEKPKEKILLNDSQKKLGKKSKKI